MFTEQCFLWGNTTPPCFSSLALICPSWQFPSGSPWFHILMPPFSLPLWNLWSKTRLPFGYWLWNAASVVCSQIHGPHTKRGSPWGTPISSAVYTHKESWTWAIWRAQVDELSSVAVEIGIVWWRRSFGFCLICVMGLIIQMIKLILYDS